LPRNTLHQKSSLSGWSFHPRLSRQALFITPSFLSPSPPRHFGTVTRSQPTAWKQRRIQKFSLMGVKKNYN
jgi:hypothetical protein